jgi:hypothetical protein
VSGTPPLAWSHPRPASLGWPKPPMAIEGGPATPRPKLKKKIKKKIHWHWGVAEPPLEETYNSGIVWNKGKIERHIN